MVSPVSPSPHSAAAHGPTTPIIEARGLVRAFGDFRAVDGIDFDVQPGECFGMLGPNGAGKSTAIRMITCAMPPSGGTLSVDGLDVLTQDREVKARIGVVAQQDNLDGELTVRQNLRIYARYFGIPAREAERRIAEYLDLMQLGDSADHGIAQLSGGMRRRLVIARALLNEPRLVVLDEPTTGLDPQARHLVWRKLRQLRERGVTLLLTTHYMDEAAQLCDRLVILDRGRILEHGTPRDLIARHAGEAEVLEMHLARAERERVQAFLAPYAGAPARVEEIEDVLYAYGLPGDAVAEAEALVNDRHRVIRRRAHLEDVFLTLTGRGLVE